MIYDDNWKSYAMYVTGTVESSCDYGCIEKSAMQGIGIMQWTNGRSWQLLNLMVTDYPNTLSLFPILGDKIKPGSTSWGEKAFTQSEANEISAAIVTTEGVSTQNKLWSQDCDESYIPLLRDECGLTDPKGAVYALTVYHQSPRAFYQIYNACGNASLETWYNTTLNNGIVGKYKTRQNTVYDLLSQWDGESGKDGFGTTNPTETVGGDNNPNNGNPDDTFSTVLTSVSMNRITQNGNELILHCSVSGVEKQLIFYKGGSGMWFPQLSNQDEEQNTVDTPVPDTPTHTGTNEDIEWILNKEQELKGTLQYSQAASLRTNIEGGYCDCSGLVWWLYNQRGYSIGTSTWSQIYSGELIEEGTAGTLPDETKMQLGDLCLFNWGNGTQHVELYIGNNTTIGHGGDPYLGPTEKTLSGQCSAAYGFWMVRRIIKL